MYILGASLNVYINNVKRNTAFTFTSLNNIFPCHVALIPQGHAKCLNFVLVHGKNISLMSFAENSMSNAPLATDDDQSTEKRNLFRNYIYLIHVFIRKVFLELLLNL